MEDKGIQKNREERAVKGEDTGSLRQRWRKAERDTEAAQANPLSPGYKATVTIPQAPNLLGAPAWGQGGLPLAWGTDEPGGADTEV